jgi:hypothetical protein
VQNLGEPGVQLNREVIAIIGRRSGAPADSSVPSVPRSAPRMFRNPR